MIHEKMKEKDQLERAYKMNQLNENGLRNYIGYLRNEIQDLKPRRDKALEEDTKHRPFKKPTQKATGGK